MNGFYEYDVEYDDEGVNEHAYTSRHVSQRPTKPPVEFSVRVVGESTKAYKIELERSEMWFSTWVPKSSTIIGQPNPVSKLVKLVCPAWLYDRLVLKRVSPAPGAQTAFQLSEVNSMLRLAAHQDRRMHGYPSS